MEPPAPEAGDEPFGSVLVAADGTVPAEDHDRVASGDRTRHPEFEPARRPASHLSPGERTAATVHTSGRALPDVRGRPRVGGPNSASCTSPPVRTLPVHEVAPGVAVEGPVPELAGEVRDPHHRFLHRGDGVE